MCTRANRASVPDSFHALAAALLALASAIVALGTSQEGRELSPDEIAGALVGQVERLVIDRYRREHPAPVTAAVGTSHDSPLTSMSALVTDGERSADGGPPANVTDIRALL